MLLRTSRAWRQPHFHLVRCVWASFSSDAGPKTVRRTPGRQRDPNFSFSSSRHPPEVQLQDESYKVKQQLVHLSDNAQSAKYSNVKAIVEELILHYGYKPDASIYEALILANADPLNGSAQEIQGWRAEMAKASLLPDSAIHHAALRVTHPAVVFDR